MRGRLRRQADTQRFVDQSLIAFTGLSGTLTEYRENVIIQKNSDAVFAGLLNDCLAFANGKNVLVFYCLALINAPLVRLDGARGNNPDSSGLAGVEHHGRVLVFATFLVAALSRYHSRISNALPGLF